MLGVVERADIFVVPNIPVKGDAEGFGLVALEGTMAQKTVLASDLEGLKDVIKDGENGCILPTMDSAAWVKKIQQLSLEKTNLREFGLKAKQYSIQNFSWNKMCMEYFQSFEYLLKKNINQSMYQDKILEIS